MSKSVIHKFVLEFNSRQSVSMPVGSIILSIQVQKGVICLWAMVDKEETEKEDRYFRIYGTGEEVTQSEGRFLATVQLDHFVFHIFEIWKDQWL